MVKCHLCVVNLKIMSEIPEWDSDTVATVRKYALQNAVEYDGRGQAGSVLGRLLSERDDLRPMAKQLRNLVESEVKSANELAEDHGIDRVRLELEAIDPEALVRKKQQKIEGLRALAGNPSNVVLRFAPNPNGPLTLGHSRGVVINSEYAAMHDGIVVLRFDDTDTKVKAPLVDAYKWIEEEFEWLSGRPADVVIRASERMPVYLEHAERMIADDFGYVCRCSAEEFRAFREQKEECPCRNRETEESLSDWKSMNDGQIPEGGAVVRVKTDMALPNPALRDWPALRIQHNPHPIIGNRYNVWPLLDFQSAIEDHEQGVTHIIRGKDLMDSTRKQTLLYEHFGWKYPEPLYWGRVKIHEFGGFSTSEMREEIGKGAYCGWEDIRLPTIKALRRRGFSPQSLRDFWIDIGLTQKDIAIPMQTLGAFNSSLIDSNSERRSFVADPVTLEIANECPVSQILPPRHPDGAIPGCREWAIGSLVCVQSEDAGFSEFRLKEFADVELKDGTILIESIKRSDERPIVHWIPEQIARVAELLRPAGEEIYTISGVIEDFELKVGEVYQLERVGFAKVESLPAEGPVELLWLHG